MPLKSIHVSVHIRAVVKFLNCAVYFPDDNSEKYPGILYPGDMTVYRGRTFTFEYDPKNLPIQLRVENSRSGGISKLVTSVLNSHKIKVLHKLMTFHFLNC